MSQLIATFEVLAIECSWVALQRWAHLVRGRVRDERGWNSIRHRMLNRAALKRIVTASVEKHRLFPVHIPTELVVCILHLAAVEEIDYWFFDEQHLLRGGRVLQNAGRDYMGQTRWCKRFLRYRMRGVVGPHLVWCDRGIITLRRPYM